MGQKKRLKRIVFDTNVIISALLFTGGSERVLTLIQDGEVNYLCSADMVKELSRVLGYPKFELTSAEASALITKQILPYIIPVIPGENPRIITEDPSDNIFLGCAVKGKADAIVSGDKHLLKLREFEGIPILTLRSFLDQVYKTSQFRM